ncbi:MAG: XRE family transcriptional regulator [Heliobacteriaceae bacterium]|jgi:hypothetical protein|nr:XRE family transcriptional regulator [Heliobacteriaceae bacterium]
MDSAQKIRMPLAYKNISEAGLARQLNTSPPAFNGKMKRDKFTAEELREIASVLDAEYHFYFELPDATKI